MQNASADDRMASAMGKIIFELIRILASLIISLTGAGLTIMFFGGWWAWHWSDSTLLRYGLGALLCNLTGVNEYAWLCWDVLKKGKP